MVIMNYFIRGTCLQLSALTHLVDHELCNPLVQLAVGATEDHLQHVTVHLLHHHIYLQ